MNKKEISPLINLCYDLLVAISEDRVLATHGNNISLIRFDGTIICTYDLIIIPTMEDNDYIVNEDDNVLESIAKNIDEYLIILTDGKCGLIDYNGNIILEPIYRDITFDNYGRVEVLP